jgi:succinate dehydrogenase / fumarate reductase cytochrome b subunit
MSTLNSLLQFYHSSVGKKFVVGATGLFLCTFLVVHVSGNLLLFRGDGGAAFEAFSEFMAHNVIIRTLEIVLFAGFILHIVTSTILWLRNKRARPKGYAVNKPLENSSFPSRITFVTGSVIFIFLVIHMKSFWVTSRFFAEENPSMYSLVVKLFANGVYDSLYLIALLLLGFHLRHGFQSAFQTFGVRGKKYEGLIEAIGAIFWLIIPIAFASMPVYFFMHS